MNKVPKSFSSQYVAETRIMYLFVCMNVLFFVCFVYYIFFLVLCTVSLILLPPFWRVCPARSQTITADSGLIGHLGCWNKGTHKTANLVHKLLNLGPEWAMKLTESYLLYLGSGLPLTDRILHKAFVVSIRLDCCNVSFRKSQWLH